MELRQDDRVKPDVMRQAILRLCSDNYLNKEKLSQLLHKTPKHLGRYLSELVANGMLQYKFPEKPTHVNQAYKAVQSIHQLQIPLDF